MTRHIPIQALLALLVTAVAAQAAPLIGYNVNFQPEGAPIPEGYLPDYGDAFGLRPSGFTYGWDVANDETRDRGDVEDQRYDTINHMQNGGTFTWEFQLDNGLYDVFVVAGDPGYTDQTNDLLIEGVLAVDPDGEDNFDEYTVRVQVDDGRLTIAPGPNADNAKIAFTEITLVPEPASMAVLGLGGMGVLLRRRRS